MPLTCCKRRPTNIQLLLCNTHNGPNIYPIKNFKSKKKYQSSVLGGAMLHNNLWPYFPFPLPGIRAQNLSFEALRSFKWVCLNGVSRAASWALTWPCQRADSCAQLPGALARGPAASAEPAGAAAESGRANSSGPPLLLLLLCGRGLLYSSL